MKHKIGETLKKCRLDANKTVKEIADETNLTIKGVEYHITKALKALRINLKDYLPLFYFLFS